MATLLKQAILLKPGEDALLHRLALACVEREIHEPVTFNQIRDRLMTLEAGKRQVNVAQMSEVLAKLLRVLTESLEANPRGTLALLDEYGH